MYTSVRTIKVQEAHIYEYAAARKLASCALILCFDMYLCARTLMLACICIHVHVHACIHSCCMHALAPSMSVCRLSSWVSTCIPLTHKDMHSRTCAHAVFCSGMPPLILGIFEKDISEKVIEKYPGKRVYDCFCGSLDVKSRLTQGRVLSRELL